MTSTNDPLVSTAWLAAHINDADVKVVDATFKLPGVLPLPKDDYLAAHIPSALFFDVDAVSDHSNPLPHMFPSAEQFGRDVGGLAPVGGDAQRSLARRILVRQHEQRPLEERPIEPVRLELALDRLIVRRVERARHVGSKPTGRAFEEAGAHRFGPQHRRDVGGSVAGRSICRRWRRSFIPTSCSTR